MDHPRATRLDIDLYQRTLKLSLSDAARNETLAFLVDAELRLQIGTASVLRKQEQ